MWPIEKKIYALSFLLHGLDHESMARPSEACFFKREKHIGLGIRDPVQTMEKKGHVFFYIGGNGFVFFSLG